jgi:hypothetical protein
MLQLLSAPNLFMLRFDWVNLHQEEVNAILFGVQDKAILQQLEKFSYEGHFSEVIDSSDL